MAKNEPNKPDDVKITPENEQTTPVTEVPAPELTVEEAATLSHESSAALHDIGDDGLEPPTPFEIPAPGDVVVPFDKINEIISEKQDETQGAEQTATPEKQETEKSEKAPKKQAWRNKVAPQKVQKAGAEDTRREWEKPLPEVDTHCVIPWLHVGRHWMPCWRIPHSYPVSLSGGTPIFRTTKIDLR